MSSDTATTPWTFGPQLLPDGRTRFRLWAPSLSDAPPQLMVVGQPEQPMHAAGDGWFEATAECGPGTHYRFEIPAKDGGAPLQVPDPASRLQHGDVHGPSVVVDPAAYQWQHTQWQGRPWRETVLYELHVGLLGGYAGVAAKLPELAALGFTAIELMPVADFPGKHNWGYDGVLPYAPDTAYGSPDELRRLIDTAHGLGLMVFLDVVYNHFGPDGNYLHAYAEPFFRTDLDTPWGVAIDFRQHAVRSYFTENALMWLADYRFDGLRFDAVHAISEADWLDEMAATVRERIAAREPNRHIHLVLEHDGNAARHLSGTDTAKFNAQWNDDAHHVLHVLLAGEHGGYYADYAGASAERLARWLAEGFIYQGEGSAHRSGEPRGEPSAQLPPGAFVNFLQNHDQTGNRAMGERLTALADPAALRAAVALLLLNPQVPLVFMGEEDGSRTPFLYFTDHNAELAKLVREGRRKEFASFPAFADPKAREQIPDPNDPATFWASRPQPAPDTPAWQALYRQLLTLRAQVLAPRLDGARSLGASAIGPAAVTAQWRLGDGHVLRIWSNLGHESIDVDVPAKHADERVLFDSLADAATDTAASLASGKLPAHTTLVCLRGGA